jgi:hypothetical protein
MVQIRSRAETLSLRLETKQYTVSFQIVPPEATLSVNGKVVPVNPQGFAQIKDLTPGSHTYMVRANGYQDRIATFDPSKEQAITLTLSSNDPFRETKDKFFKKVQQVGGRRDFRIELWTDKTHYALGDAIFFNFRSERDCFLNLVNITSDGEIRVIFPNRFHPDNFVKGGRTYRIPDQSYGFSFEVEPPVGTERVYAIAGTRPFNIFDTDFKEDAFLTMTRGNTSPNNVRGIGIRLDQADLSAAADCVIQIGR